jgi:hypothetical protein
MDEEGSATDVKNNPWKNLTRRVTMEHSVDRNWRSEYFMEFYALDYPAMMERGILPLKVNHLSSTERFNGRIGLLGLVPSTNTTRPLPKPLTGGLPSPVVGNSGSVTQSSG